MEALQQFLQAEAQQQQQKQQHQQQEQLAAESAQLFDPSAAIAQAQMLANQVAALNQAQGAQPATSAEKAGSSHPAEEQPPAEFVSAPAGNSSSGFGLLANAGQFPTQGPSGIKITYNLYVGDLRLDVTEEDLVQAFSACGPIHSVHLIRDKYNVGKTTGESKGFGFIHFTNKESLDRALSAEFRHVTIKGRPVKTSPTEDKNTLFVGNIPTDVTQHELQTIITSLCGPSVVSVELKIGPPPQCLSRGFCFVTFDNHDNADRARKLLQQQVIRGKQLSVSWAESRPEVSEEVMAKVKTLFVRNIHTSVTDDQLRALFSQFGIVTNCVIVKDSRTRLSRGFAFVEYADRASAEKALSMNGYILSGQPLSVELAKPAPEHKKIKSRDASRGGGGGGRGGRFDDRPSRDYRDDYDDYRGGRGGRRGGRGGFEEAGPARHRFERADRRDRPYGRGRDYEDERHEPQPQPVQPPAPAIDPATLIQAASILQAAQLLGSLNNLTALAQGQSLGGVAPLAAPALAATNPLAANPLATNALAVANPLAQLTQQLTAAAAVPQQAPPLNPGFAPPRTGGGGVGGGGYRPARPY